MELYSGDNLKGLVEHALQNEHKFNTVLDPKDVPHIKDIIYTKKLPGNVAMSGHFASKQLPNIIYFIGSQDFKPQYIELVRSMQWSEECKCIVGDMIVLQQSESIIHICLRIFPSIRKLMKYLEIPSAQIIYYREKWHISELAALSLKCGVNVIAKRLNPRNEFKLYDLYYSFGIGIPSDCEYLELCNLKITKKCISISSPRLCPHSENLLTLFGYYTTNGYNINCARYGVTIYDNLINVNDLNIDVRAAFKSLTQQNVSVSYLLRKIGYSSDEISKITAKPFDNDEQILQAIAKKLDEMNGKQISLLPTLVESDIPYEKYYPIEKDVHHICVICQTNVRNDGLGIATLKCGHVFHYNTTINCGGIVKLTVKKCPLCRQPF